MAAEKFGTDGNLWKPVSDTSGNMVIVLSPKFKKVFSGGCTAKLNNGKTDTLFCGGVYKCFGNPYNGQDRLHLRGNFKCSSYSEVSVLCKEEKQEVTFTVDKRNLKKVCERF